MAVCKIQFNKCRFFKLLFVHQIHIYNWPKTAIVDFFESNYIVYQAGL